MFSLYRGALESFSYFWYMRRKPSEFNEWKKALGLDDSEPLNAESQNGNDELKTRFEWAVEQSGAFNGFRIKVKRCFEGEADKGQGRKDLFKLLSTLGSHTNPYSLADSLPNNGSGNNLRICSTGNNLNLQCGVYYVLILLDSLIEEVYAEFGKHIPTDHDLRNRKAKLEQHLLEYIQSLPNDWVCTLPLGRTSI